MPIDILPYEAIRHRGGVRQILAKNAWLERYIAAQLAALDALKGDPLPGTRARVWVCEVQQRLRGLVCVEYRGWNRPFSEVGLPALRSSRKFA